MYVIRENFVKEKWRTFVKILALFPGKVFLDKVFIFAVREQVEFCGDKFLWIWWKSSSPRKLIHAKINLAKVYLLEVKKNHNKETATWRSSTKFVLQKTTICSIILRKRWITSALFIFCYKSWKMPMNEFNFYYNCSAILTKKEVFANAIDHKWWISYFTEQLLITDSGNRL